MDAVVFYSWHLLFTVSSQRSCLVEKAVPLQQWNFGSRCFSRRSIFCRLQRSRVSARGGEDIFEKMQHRFLKFKKNEYMENLEHFKNLAKGQTPKFMVIACADSRVCPSKILGFEPGEAFVVRNVANLVPPFEKGATETIAALEFAVMCLEVENILVMGHSCCGGIKALMKGEDESSLVGSWIRIAEHVRSLTESSVPHLSFDQQCRWCEKESVNNSLVALLGCPWIEEKVRNGVLSIHGGYYDFMDCSFEKWTVDYAACALETKPVILSSKGRMVWS